ncbi:MAG: TatD family hydrolase [Fluviicoccus sp.]|uniref:TatD family hydrolase n=1 Tax=Fluviicoccus sp. TaxID=2003552 RepID=UPI00271B21EB|nr:TatD family hydrolase [Fluviicoccus sp.]MDO8330722.1 TatD family hydrolase [Fluviicoccus sp.]
MWIDTHCHFDVEDFDGDRPEVAARSFQAGVEAIVIPGYLAQRWGHLLEVCQTISQPRLLAAPGLHPCYIRQHQPEHLEQLDALLRRHVCVAIGEIGLDTYVPELKEPDLYRKQQDFFCGQLQLARQHDKPVILHVRKAHADIFRLLKEQGFQNGGIVHAFSGGVEEARHYYRLGFKLGIGGSLTYAQAKRLHAVVAAMPLEALVIETDAPDMIPQSRRNSDSGKTRNSPEFLPLVAAALAEAKQVSLETLCGVLRKNSEEVLRLV